MNESGFVLALSEQVRQLLIAHTSQVLSHEAASVVKQEGKSNDLIARIKQDPYFRTYDLALDELLDSRHYIGRAPEQVNEFLRDTVMPALEPWKATVDDIGMAELSV